MSDFVNDSFKANADLSSSQYYMLVNSVGNLVDAAGSGAVVIGVLQNKPESGEHASVTMVGKTRVKAGGTITEGQLFMSDASGTATAVTSGQWVAGHAITGVASGGYFDAVIRGGYNG